jgi:uncharacterized membrane protein
MHRPRTLLAFSFVLVVALAAALRIWRLDVPPAWLDEAVTVLVVAGRGPDSIPVGRVVPAARIADVERVPVTATARDVLALIRHPLVQHTHPPLFYLIANATLRSTWARWADLTTAVRSVAVLFGVAAVAALFLAGREAFDDATGLAAAALAAASPFAVMLSREARNYSLPLLTVTLSLWALFAILRRSDDGRSTAWWWTLWAASCAAGLYAHYFVAFCCVAEALVLAHAGWRRRSMTMAAALSAASAAAAVAFSPWIASLRTHMASPEQGWMRFTDAWSVLIVPYQTLSAWQTMILGKAWDVRYEWIYDASKLFALVYGGWVLVVVLGRVRHASSATREDRAVRVLAAVVLIVLVEFAAAMTLQGKNFVSEVRYHFVCYPALTLLAAVAFLRRPTGVPAIVILAALGALNSVLVDLDVESWKATEASSVAARLGAAPEPLLIVAGTGTFHETASQLALLFELIRQRGVEHAAVAFVPRADSYVAFGSRSDPSLFWQGLSALRVADRPATVWMHDAGMRADEYPASIALSETSGSRTVCAGVPSRQPEKDNLVARPAFRRYACASDLAGVRATRR